MGHAGDGHAHHEAGEGSVQAARALVAVRGMDSPEAKYRVNKALADVVGVLGVQPGEDDKIIVDYDPSEVTVMDLIRALRRIGFLAGME